MAPKQQRVLRSSTKPTSRASRHAKPAVSYREPSSDIDSELDDPQAVTESDGTADELLERRKSTRRRQRALPALPTGSSQTLLEEHKRKRPTAVQIIPARLAKSPSKNKHNHPEHYGVGIVPPWTSLPYQILVQIFHYASYPLYDDRTFQPSASVDWLVKTSRICQAFTEPALTILYRSPPLVPMDRAHRLRQLLMAEQGPMSYNYRAKIERLVMEISQTAAYTLPGSGLLDLYGLIYNCPRLLDLELYHQKDMSPYRSLDDAIKWTYPDSLFYALDKNVSGTPTNLRSWRWSSRLAGKKRPIESLLAIHQSPSFSGLRKIAFVNYQKPLERKNAVDPQHEKLLAESLSVLNLEHLILESSTLANSKLLLLLPTNLKHLELINCWEVMSDDLAAYLVSHGSQLRSLTLNHNQSLSLSFLTVLGTSCQQLATLKMNLTYYNVHSTYRDSEPQYERLLYIDEMPDWPSSLQTIELTQLRNWDIDAAKMFFQSLLDSAATLLNLRRLVIKAILNTSWRDRSSFRDEWVGAFERVFKRPFTQPNPHLRSLDAYAAHKKQSYEPALQQLEEENNGILHRSLKHRRLNPMGEDLEADSLPVRTLRSVNGTLSRAPRKLDGSVGNRQACEDSEEGGGGGEKGKFGTSIPRPQTPNIRRSARLGPGHLSPQSEPDANQPPVKSKLQQELCQLNRTDGSGHPDVDHLSQRETARKRVRSRELEALQKTAGVHEPWQEKVIQKCYNSKANTGHDSDSDSDGMPLARRAQKSRARQVEFIQGLCNVVSITIDNLRPTETQFVEADFLDSEPEGDEDWDGTEDNAGDRDYAW